jgi:hypothetical protein
MGREVSRTNKRGAFMMAHLWVSAYERLQTRAQRELAFHLRLQNFAGKRIIPGRDVPIMRSIPGRWERCLFLNNSLFVETFSIRIPNARSNRSNSGSLVSHEVCARSGKGLVQQALREELSVRGRRHSRVTRSVRFC